MSLIIGNPLHLFASAGRRQMAGGAIGSIVSLAGSGVWGQGVGVWGQVLPFAPDQLVSTRTSFHADDALRQLRHQRDELAAADGLAQHGLAVGVDAMHTEDVLGQIDTDGGELSYDFLH